MCDFKDIKKCGFFSGRIVFEISGMEILIPFNAGFFKYVIIDVYCLYIDKNCQVTESVYLLSGKIYLLSGKQSTWSFFKGELTILYLEVVCFYNTSTIYSKSRSHHIQLLLS